ncbi:response regulator [Ramlibacter tataouinensis]|uniref:Candidate response regulator, NarL n=1 Tax=Ramlibacter tataouinensis (strain ATCC BAA-407 / DSM 14655 / LMG 21543 / TTB310) TaxID=365046 RepID=F5XX74_RAMTT|nr:response regulator transcription factor [Ramlibacter tataouinensis]AEG93018.1 candidate response regulator, NarL [Ramlibacter tataouinensis TTB310]
MNTETGKNNPMRVVLADDHLLVRVGLRALLGDMDGVEVVGEAGEGREALRLVQQLRPDILLTDIAMPQLGGLPLLREIRAADLPVKVILLSMHDNDEYVAEAIRLGASGYIVKSAAAEELASAIQAVSQGDAYLSPRIAGKLTQAFSGGHSLLTERQTDVLRLIARGASSKEVARSLNLSVKTVETHRSQIMDRLGIRDLAGLVRYAVRKGLIDPEE